MIKLTPEDYVAVKAAVTAAPPPTVLTSATEEEEEKEEEVIKAMLCVAGVAWQFPDIYIYASRHEKFLLRCGVENMAPTFQSLGQAYRKQTNH